MKRTLKLASRAAAASLALSLALPAGAFVAGASSLADPGMAPAVQAQGEQLTVPAAIHKAVPLRAYSEAVGAVVTWDADSFTAFVERGDKRLAAKIGANELVVNEQPIALDKPIELVDEKTVVSLASLNEALGIDADWDEQDAALVISHEDYELRASAFAAAIAAARTNEARAEMNDNLQSLLPEQLLMQLSQSIGQLARGQLGAQQSAKTTENEVHRNVTIAYGTPFGLPLEIVVRFDKNGKVDEWLALPPSPQALYQPPAYESSELFSEQEVTVGTGAFALPGTLTMPVGDGPFPAVVLVHGSGMNDRDESIGAAKPFRDLAVGLAAKGIAVLRYEKITREHPFKSQQLVPFTANEETVNDAVRAVELLQATPGIDTSAIFVAGHSQGGMLMPRIIDHAPDNALAGAIVLAGPSRPLEDLLIEQLQFQTNLLKQSGQPTEAAEQQLAVYQQQVKLLKDEQYTADNPPPGFLLGDLQWWLDIRNLYAAEEAVKQQVPLFIIQGGNDIQVFPDNLDGWKKALADRSDVQYELYPKLNHVLVEYEGASTGAEYNLPGNVPVQLIGDVADWIKAHRP